MKRSAKKSGDSTTIQKLQNSFLLQNMVTKALTVNAGSQTIIKTGSAIISFCIEVSETEGFRHFDKIMQFKQMGGNQKNAARQASDTIDNSA